MKKFALLLVEPKPTICLYVNVYVFFFSILSGRINISVCVSSIRERKRKKTKVQAASPSFLFYTVSQKLRMEKHVNNFSMIRAINITFLPLHRRLSEVLFHMSEIKLQESSNQIISKIM